MTLSYEAMEAARFWHERVGRWLGNYNRQASIGGAYPMKTASGQVKRIRIGGGAPSSSTILIDGNDAIVVERLFVPGIPALSDGPGAAVRILEGHPECSLRKGVMQWILDPRRIYPLLAVMPGKASVLTSLRLSHVPFQTFVCSPGRTLGFDAVKVRSAREEVLRRTPDNPASWRDASRMRGLVSNPSFMRSGSSIKNKGLRDYAATLEIFPLDVWLPSEGEPEYWALGEALIKTQALDLEG